MLVVLVAARGYVRVGVPFDRAVIAVLDLPPDEGTLLLHLGRWIVLPMVVAGTWWTWAARLYLRMDRPALVGWSVAAVATFVSTVATQLVRGII